MIYIYANRCRISEFCVSFLKFKRISPANQLVLSGICLDGCEDADSVTYSFTIFKNLGNYSFFIWEELSISDYSLFVFGINLFDYFL